MIPIGIISGGGFPTYTDLVTATGTTAVPAGAEWVTIESYDPGAEGSYFIDGSDIVAISGLGGTYRKENNYPLAGLTGIYCLVNASSPVVVKENSVGGTVITLNDLVHAGGSGAVGIGVMGGGGAGGPDSVGANGTTGVGGAPGGGLGGRGANSPAESGVNYGGGGSANEIGETSLGGAAAVRLTWS